jgi:hypothetical protein
METVPWLSAGHVDASLHAEQGALPFVVLYEVPATHAIGLHAVIAPAAFVTGVKLLLIHEIVHCPKPVVGPQVETALAFAMVVVQGGHGVQGSDPVAE